MGEERKFAVQADAVLIRHLRFLVRFKELIERLKEETKSGKLDQRKITKLLNSFIAEEHHEKPIEVRIRNALWQFNSILGSVERHIAISAPASVEKIEEAKRRALELFELMLSQEGIDSLLQKAKKSISELNDAIGHLDKAIQADKALYKVVQGTEVIAEKGEKVPVANVAALIRELRDERYCHIVLGSFGHDTDRVPDGEMLNTGTGVQVRKIIGTIKRFKKTGYGIGYRSYDLGEYSYIEDIIRNKLKFSVSAGEKGTCAVWGKDGEKKDMK
jgi:hypothetical protein